MSFLVSFCIFLKHVQCVRFVTCSVKYLSAYYVLGIVLGLLGVINIKSEKKILGK